MKKLLQILLLAVNVVFALLLVASTLAGTVAPSRFVWFSLLSYGYVYLLLINIAFVLIWLFMARKECLVSIITIILRFTFLPLFVQLGGNSNVELEDGANLLRVMSFNVHQFQGRDDDPEAMVENAKDFVELVRTEGPDVMCLQEFFEVRGVGVYDSLKSLGYKYSYGINMSKSGIPAGVAVFSRYPIDYVNNIDKTQKFYVDIIKREEIIRVVCVHLMSYQLTEEDKVEIDRAVHGTLDSNMFKTIAKFKSAILGHEHDWHEHLLKTITETNRPMVLAGDFNDTPASYIYQKMKKFMKDTYVEQGRGFCATYHGKFPDFRIDYIWHSSQLTALSYKRIKNSISDHYPIIAEFKIN